MVEVRDYRFGDLSAIKVRPEQGEAITQEVMGGIVQSKAITLLHEGEIVAIGGLRNLAPHRKMAWAVVADNVPAQCWRHILIFARVVLLRAASETPRIEAYCRADWRAARRTLDHLGFVEEGLLKHMLPDGDGVIARFD